MSQTLYRKYRPLNFNDIADQNHIKITLKNAVASDKLAHAYLFIGPHGVGKTTTARVFAKAVNCLDKKSGEPCNKCAICTDINKGNFLDLVELDAASRRKIEEIKEFKEHVGYPPNTAKYKVFIIDEVHMLTEVSFNALLKTLEEPPNFAIFILCTTAVHKIPDTIISRCQRFDFKKLTIAEIINNLKYIVSQEKIKIDDEILESIARLSEGALRDAQGILGQAIALGGNEITKDQATLVLPRSEINSTLELWEYLVTNEVSAAIQLLNRLANDGVDMVYFTDNLSEFLRKILLIKVDKKLDRLKDILSNEQYKSLMQLSDRVSLDFIQQSLEIILKRKEYIKLVQPPQLVLELAVIDIVKLGHHDDSMNDTNSKDDLSNPGNTDNVVKKSEKKEKKEQIKKIEKQASKITNNSSGSIKDSIIQAVQDNYSLSGVLKSSEINYFSKNKEIKIIVTHAFHQDQINKPKNLNLIQKAIHQQLGNGIAINVLIGKPQISPQALKNNNQQEIIDVSENYVDDIIKVFGGQVVESGVVEE